MANPATTFRFDPETRATLEQLRDEFQVATLQATVEVLIYRYRKDQDRIKELSTAYLKANNERHMYLERLKAIKSAFNIILEYNTEE